jgi:hypothetical protein
VEAEEKLDDASEKLWQLVKTSRSGIRYWVRVMKFNDQGYPWSLHDCALMVRDGLRELGYDAYFDDERIDYTAGWPTPEERSERIRTEQQIIIGGNIATHQAISSIPDSAIVYNFEQVGGHQFAGPYLGLLRRTTVWEYHPANIEKLKYYFNIHAILVPFGYVPAMVPQLYTPLEYDFDVLFFGSMNPPRKKIVNDLKLMGLRVMAPEGAYGEDRVDLMRRSKLVLNVHYYQRVKILEVVRLGVAMAACRAVVTQLDPDTVVDPYYLPGVAGAPYDSLVETVSRLVKDDVGREKLALKGYELFTARKATDSLMKGISAYVARQPAALPQSYERSTNAPDVTYRRVSRFGAVR